MARRNRTPLTRAERRKRAGVAAVAAVLSVTVAIASIVVARLTAGDADGAPGAVESSAPLEGSTPTKTVGNVVDASATERGWFPQPITEDPRAYGEAAAVALATYDTTLATRDNFIAYLGTWHTADYRFNAGETRDGALKEGIGIVGESMIPNSEAWRQSVLSKTIITAKVVASKLDKEHLDFTPESIDGYVAQGQHVVTTEVVLTTSSEDNSTGQRAPFDRHVQISVLILCGHSFPPAGSGQTAASCMIMNYVSDPFV